MSIKLDFPNGVAGATAVNVYRSTSPLAITALGSPIATLGGSVTTYTDTTAAANTVYYYRVEIVAGTESIVSPNVSMGNLAKTGPGPKTILRGDWALGYFGTVAPADFIQFSDLYTQLGLTLGTKAADTAVTAWHKFAWKGKVLFIPNAPFLTATGFNPLYAAGLIYGVDSNGSPPSGSASANAPVNQKKVATIGTDTFLVRAPRGSTQPDSTLLASVTDGSDGSEWVQLFCRTVLATGLFTGTDKWNDTAMTSIITFQHCLTTAINQAANVNTMTSYQMTNTQQAYLPVLELIL